jgi:hypothetical protein
MNIPIPILKQYLINVEKFTHDAHTILSTHESSIKSRAIILEDTLKKISDLSLRQDELFKEAIRCIENELYRASVVMAWNGFIDYFFEKIPQEDFQKIKKRNTNWKYDTIEKMIEYQSEYSIIEVMKSVDLISKTEMKTLHGFLNTRNKCGHPSDYFPDKNEAVGYLSSLINQIKMFKEKSK